MPSEISETLLKLAVVTKDDRLREQNVQYKNIMNKVNLANV